MAQISREASAPITDGETASAADVENEFVKIFDEINGGLDTTNIDSAAGILGTQIAGTTILASNVTASTLTTAQMAASAVPKLSVDTADHNGAMTTSLTLVDVPTISGITLTPGSTSDIVVMELQILYSTQTGALGIYDFGFNIDDGTGDVLVARHSLDALGAETYTAKHIMTATAASSTTYTARYRKVSGNTGNLQSGVFDYNIMFSVMILPIK